MIKKCGHFWNSITSSPPLLRGNRSLSRRKVSEFNTASDFRDTICNKYYCIIFTAFIKVSACRMFPLLLFDSVILFSQVLYTNYCTCRNLSINVINKNLNFEFCEIRAGEKYLHARNQHILNDKNIEIKSIMYFL